MAHTSAAFVIDVQQPRALDLADDSGVTYGALTLSKTFTGAIEGASTVEMLYTRTPGEDGSFLGAGYVALERITGSVDGRAGSGELAGITGVGLITIGDDGSHTLHLDYEVE